MKSLFSVISFLNHYFNILDFTKKIGSLFYAIQGSLCGTPSEERID